MKKFSLALLFASALALAACGDGRDESSSLNAASVPSTAIRIGSASTACTGSAPRLVFGGTDAAGRALFNAISQNINVPSSSCDIRAQILIERGFRIRIKTITFRGTYSSANSTFGTVNVQAGLRTAPTYTVKQDIRNGIPNPFLRTDSSMRVTDWTQCSKIAFPGETLLIRPSKTILGAIAGKPAVLNSNLIEANASIEVERCVP